MQRTSTRSFKQKHLCKTMPNFLTRVPAVAYSRFPQFPSGARVEHNRITSTPRGIQRGPLRPTHPMKIRVAHGARRHEVTISGSATVAELKDKLQPLTGVPPQAQVPLTPPTQTRLQP